MNVLTLLSFAALVVAALAPAYFAVVLRRENAEFSRLAALLAAALLLHAGYHGAQLLGVGETLVHWVEASSAFLILAFAVSYWRIRRRRPS